MSRSRMLDSYCRRLFLMCRVGWMDLAMLSPNRSKNLIACCILIALCTSACSKSARQYLERGNQLYSDGKYDDAALNYRNAIKKDSQSGEAHYRLSLALIKLNKGVEAYQNLNRAVSLSPENAAAKTELASLCLAVYARDTRHPAALYNQARSLTDQLLAKNPNSPEALRLKGAIALIDNRPSDAVDSFQHALRLTPDSMQLMTDLAEAMLKDNRLEAGEQAAKLAIAKHPQYAPPYELLYAFYVSQQRQSDAEALLKLRIANNPNDSAPVMRLAAEYFQQQKPAEGENLLNGLLQRRNNIPQVDLLVGDFHMLVRNYDKALADYQRGQSLDKAHALDYQEREASALLATRHADQSLKILDTILTGDSKNRFARSLKSEILTQLGGATNVNTAASLATDLAKEAPRDTRAQMIAGRALMVKGDLEGATTHFRLAASNDPQLLAPRLALAQIGVQRKNYPAVLENAAAALAIRSSDPTARLFRIIGLTGTGSYAQARSEAQQLAGSTKNAAPVEMELGVIALRQKNYAEAERYFQKLYREGAPDLYPLAGLVDSYMGEHEPDRALQLAEAELKRAPQSGQKAALMIATAEAAGKPDVALAELQKLADQNPKSAEIQLRIGDFQRRHDNYPAALQAFQRAQQMDPQHKGLNAIIGVIQDESGKKTDAINSYRKALAETPDDPLILNNLAFLLIQTGGDLNEALRLATAASRKAPNTPAIEDTLAWIHIKRGNSAAMIPILSQLTRKDPANANFRYHYAVALFQKGDRTTAKHELETALTDKPAKQVEGDIRNLLAQIQ